MTASARERGSANLKRFLFSAHYQALTHRRSVAEALYRVESRVWFTIDCPEGLTAEELAKRLQAWDIVEKAFPDAPAADPEEAVLLIPSERAKLSCANFVEPLTEQPGSPPHHHAWTTFCVVG